MLKLCKVVVINHFDAPGLSRNLLQHILGFPLDARERYSSDIDSALEFPWDNSKVWEIALTVH